MEEHVSQATEEEKTQPEAEKTVEKKEEIQSSTPTLDEARKQADRLEEANKEYARLLAKEEELQAKRALGGRAEGGVEEKVKEKMTDEQYANALLEGNVNPFEKDE